MILGDGHVSVVTQAVMMMALFLGPLVGFAVVIHWLERVTQKRLAERFGWGAVLWTGWLGTPIHELSHVAMCILFRHRIDDVSLFEPDFESGRLGYVKHSFRRGSWFEEIGNLFIGGAPLMGGSIVLAILLWMFYPEAARAAVAPADEVSGSTGLLVPTWHAAYQVASEILSVKSLTTVRFWVFLYLVLCVGSHMAPSGTDYRGAFRGSVMFGGGLLVTTLVLAGLGVDLSSAVELFVDLAGPLYAILGLTVGLVGLSTLIVFLVTSLIPRFRA